MTLTVEHISLLTFTTPETFSNNKRGWLAEFIQAIKMALPQPSDVEDEALQCHISIVNGEDKIDQPTPGMHFGSIEELEQYYAAYARQQGFSTRRRSTLKGKNGELRYIMLCCSRDGHHQCRSNCKALGGPHVRTNCKAHVQARIYDDEAGLIVTAASNVHNHDLSPSKIRHLRRNKQIDMCTKRKLEVNDSAGIRLCKSFQALVREARGHDRLPFDERTCRNYVNKERRWKAKEGDGEALRQYFARQINLNPQFYYSMDLDDECRIRNVFWADARTREVYKEFGDVVIFDKYDMSFALFVGVNHYGQSTLFGRGLLSHEDVESFTWLFNKFLDCMVVPPAAIVTDQCKAIMNAVSIVFSRTRHRLCLFHIMRKVPEKLRGHKMYEEIKQALQEAVYDSVTVGEFDAKWAKMMESYDLAESNWLQGLWEKRELWVPVYVNDTFWAGMTTTGRSEQMNAFFDGYIQSTTTLQQFVLQYDNALQAKVEKEAKGDFASYNYQLDCASKSPIETMFQSVYTLEKFKEVRREFNGKVDCYIRGFKEEMGLRTYEVAVDRGYGNYRRAALFHVTIRSGPIDIHCACRMFETRGILCRHCLMVLTHEGVTVLPNRFVLRRWRKDIQRAHSRIACSDITPDITKEKKRFDHLCKAFSRAAKIAACTESSYSNLLGTVEGIVQELSMNSAYIGHDMDDVICTQVKSNEGVEIAPQVSGKCVRSHLSVSRKGRPRVNRRLSKVEEWAKKQRPRVSPGASSRKTRSEVEEETNLGNFVASNEERDSQYSIIGLENIPDDVGVLQNNTGFLARKGFFLILLDEVGNAPQ